MEIKLFDKIDNITTKSFQERNISWTPNSSQLNLLSNQTSTTKSDTVLLDMFNSVPELSAPIKYCANLAAKIPYKTVSYNTKGEEIPIKLPEIDKILDKPNPYQSSTNFLRTTFINYLLFGDNYTNMHRGIGSMKFANHLYLLPVKYVNIIFDKMLYDKVDPNVDFRDNYIKYYQLKYGINNVKNIAPKDISHFKDSQLNFDDGAYAYGQSRAYSAIMATKTIKEGYETKYHFYINRGAWGMFINNDPDGAILDPKEKQRVIDDFKYNYGAKKGGSLFKFMNHNMTYQNISPDFGSLNINENNEADFRAICKAIGGFPPSLLMDNRVALLRNGAETLKQLYNSIIQPMVEDYRETQSIDFGLAENNKWIVPDYSKIEVLQENLSTKEDILTKQNNRMLALYNEGLVTGDDVLISQGLKPTGRGLKSKENNNEN